MLDPVFLGRFTRKRSLTKIIITPSIVSNRSFYKFTDKFAEKCRALNVLYFFVDRLFRYLCHKGE